MCEYVCVSEYVWVYVCERVSGYGSVGGYM